MVKGVPISEFAKLGVELQTLLQLAKPPIAIAFAAENQNLQNLEKSTETVPSSCTFWTKALNKAFYTTPDQHQNCTIGAVTHGFRLAEGAVPGCGCADVDLLASVGWITEEDIRSLPTMPHDPQRRIAYAPLAQTPFDPDVVAFFCNAEQAMFIAEAARGYKITGKPTCQALPEAYRGEVVISLGCTASRLRAGYDANELFVAIPGRKLKEFLERLKTAVHADTQVAQAVAEGKG